MISTRASTHVHQESRLVRQIHALANTQVNKAGFFLTRDDFDANTRVFGYLLDKLAAVARFTNRAGRRHQDSIKPLVPCQGRQVFQDFNAPRP